VRPVLPAGGGGGEVQRGVARVRLLGQGGEGRLGGPVHGDVAQHDQAGAELLGVGGRVDRLVGDVDVGLDVGGDRVGGGPDHQGAALQDQEVPHDQVGVHVGTEGEGARRLDLQRVQRRRAVDVVGHRVAGV